MIYKLFYSYQSDIDKDLNESFIRKALDKAIKKIKGPSIQVIKGFDGTSGNKPLAQTMFEQSQLCDIFVGDVTFTSERKNEHSIKKSPNPNVLLETGYSWAQKDYDRTILVFNTAFGEPKDLPVDFGGLRFPIKYHLTREKCDNEAEKEQVLKEFVDDLKLGIDAAIRTTQAYHRERFTPFKQFNDWKSEEFKKEYHPLSELKDKIVQLRNALNQAGNPQRIIGPKNCGKTRLAREMYQKIDEGIGHDDSIEKILYYDLSVTAYASIENQIQDLARLNQDKVVVVDNCPYRVHLQIVDALLDTNVRILTICERFENDENSFCTIEIEPALAKKVTQFTIQTKFSGHTASKLLGLVDGNVRAAVAYVNSDIEDNSDIETEYGKKWKQLIGPVAFNQGGLAVLEALSIFKHVGISGDYSHQGDFIRQKIVPEMSVEIFNSLINGFTNTGILKRQGDFVLMDTFPLELAQSWWSKNAPDDLNQFLVQISMVKLSRQLGERLVDLGHTTTSGDFVEILTGSKRIFDFDFINSGEGSQLILSLAQVAPVKVLASLESCLQGKSREDMLALSAGRRNLVWALEKLCFRKEIFVQAARLLFRLAMAENEDISNNATRQFIRLFQPYLAGTEAPLTIRLQLLFDLEDDGDLISSSIIYRCFSIGLKTRDFYREAGAEEQGGKTLEDYQPDYQELSEYRQKILAHLLTVDGGNRKKALQIIANRFKMLFLDWEPAPIVAAVKSVIKETGMDIDLRQDLTDLLSNNFNVSKEDAFSLEELLDLGKPGGIHDQITLNVIIPPYDYDRSLQIDKSQKKAKEFARQLIANSNSEWLSELRNLQQGEQRQTFSFAEQIGQLISNKEAVMDKAIDELIRVPFDNQNDTFIRGFVCGAKNETFTRSVIDQLLKNEKVKIPYYITFRDQKVRSMAGLYSRWKDKETGSYYYSYTLLTTRANSILEYVHNHKKRMPVFIAPEDEKTWLSKDLSKEQVMELCQPYQDTAMRAFTVSKLLTTKNINTNVPEVMQPMNYQTAIQEANQFLLHGNKTQALEVFNRSMEGAKLNIAMLQEVAGQEIKSELSFEI